MKFLRFILPVSVSAIVANSSSAATFTTVGVYDEQTVQVNAVDSSAPNGTTVAAFAPLVLAASVSGTGGVINFDEFGNTPPINQSTFVVNYGAGQSFSLTPSRVYDITQVSTTGTVTPISDAPGTTNIGGIFQPTIQTGTGASPDFSLAVVDPLNARLLQLGLTILSRANAAYPQTISITATFTGGGTQLLEDTIGNVKGTDDTFYGFTAPDGQFISNLFINSSSTSASDGRVVIDDFGFITAVPEPGSGLLAICGAAGLTLRRRR